MKCADSGRVMDVDVTCHELPGDSGGWSRDPVHPSSRRERTPSYVISIVFAASFVLSGFAASPAQAQVITVPPDITVPPGSIPSGATLLVGVNGGTGTVNINPTGSVTLTALGIGGTEGAATMLAPWLWERVL